MLIETVLSFTTMVGIEEITAFLSCATPDAWVEEALCQQDILLMDHAHCEKKAASTAISLIFRYVDQWDLIEAMSRIAREELRHFEQVLKIMRRRNIAYRHLEPSRYAKGLRELRRFTEPDTLVDTLIIGAFIEARSCERFAKIAPHLDKELQSFYQGLLAAEARHFLVYLRLAENIAKEDLSDRIQVFASRESELINQIDTELRFHSGPINS